MFQLGAVTAAAIGAATVLGLVWSVATGAQSTWTLLLGPPWAVGWWWLYRGFRERAEKVRA